jgi:NAD-dependent SIR2 family protein deacetylase
MNRIANFAGQTVLIHTGAGISAESGSQTLRDADRPWEGPFAVNATKLRDRAFEQTEFSSRFGSYDKRRKPLARIEDDPQL